MKQKGHFYVNDENKMLLSKITAISIVDKWAPYTIKYPQFLNWQNLIDDFIKDPQTPLGMQSVFQTANEMWAWMMTEKAFKSNALQGIGISLAFSFLVLLIYTRNVI